MSAESTYSRRGTSTGTRWDVTPAAASKGFIVFYVPVSAAAALVAAVIGAAIGEFLGLLIGLAIAAALLWFGIWKNYMGSFGHRQPASITVDEQALRAGTSSFARHDIAELGVFPGYEGPAARPVATSSAFATNNPAMMAAHGATQIASSVVIGCTKALREKVFTSQADRSLLLKLRLKQGPHWHVLAGGLSPDCAHALMTDLAAELRLSA